MDSHEPRSLRKSQMEWRAALGHKLQAMRDRIRADFQPGMRFYCGKDRNGRDPYPDRVLIFQGFRLSYQQIWKFEFLFEDHQTTKDGRPFRQYRSLEWICERDYKLIDENQSNEK